MSNINASQHTINQPVIFYPGTLCDERIFNNCWQNLHIPKRAFVPLQWAEDLAQMQMLSADRFDYFEESVHLVGFSMGGYVAALSAIEAATSVASLTLVSSACSALPSSVLAQRSHTLKLIQNKQYKGLTEPHLVKYFHQANQSDNELKGIVKLMEHDLGMGVLAAQFRATQSRKNLVPQLAKCDFPIHFVVGEQDHLVNLEQLQESVNKLPQADVNIVKNAGHMLPLEQPAFLAQMLASWIA